MTPSNRPGLRTPRARLLGLATAAAMAGGAQAATITVEIATDDPAATSCTLRDAVSAANGDSAVGGCDAGSGDDQIAFAPGLAGQTIELTRTGRDEDANATGDLDIDDPDGDALTISGSTDGDPATITIDGNSDDRVFDVHGGAVTLQAMTIQDGAGVRRGGGILVRGGELTIMNTVVRDNTVDSAGAASDEAAGGGVYAQAPLSVVESRIAGNQASTPGDSNFDDASGAGIAVEAAGITTEIVDTRVTDNVATSTSEDVTGAAIYVQQGAADRVVIRRSQISGNRAEAGLGVFGGAVRVNNGELELRNSTISGNQGSADGRGVDGAALRTRDASLDANHATITANTATCTDANCVGGYRAATGSNAQFSNSIIAGNSASGGTRANAPDCLGDVASGGYNLLGDDTGCNFMSATGDRVDIDPMLAPLADNGGPTRTHAPVDGSPAIDAGNPNPVMDGMPPACEPVDQRGESRPADGDDDGGATCDIGAFELQPGSTGDGGGGGGGGAGPGLLLFVAGAGLLRRCMCLRRLVAVHQRQGNAIS